MENIKTFLFKSFYNKKTNYSKEKHIKTKEQSIPVIVLDLKTNKFIKCVSIAEAARSLNTHSKTIWRKVQDNKLYLDRYKIIKYSGDRKSVV